MLARVVPLLAAVLLAGCGTTPADSSANTIVVGLYPAEFLATELGQGSYEVISLAAPGIDPHDLELTAKQITQIRAAALVAYIPGFQPALDEAIKSVDPARVVDLTEGLTLSNVEHTHAHQDHEATDPHIWLSPKAMQSMAQTLAARMKVDATPLVTQLSALDEQWRSGTKNCTSRALVVSHAAFGYLTDEIGFTQEALALSPDIEPSPRDLTRVAQFVRTNNISTIYTEPLVSPKVADALAQATGAKVAVLDPIESNTGSAGYLTLMRNNLAAVRAGQGCS